LQNIAGMDPAPQPAMLKVARSGNWDFGRTPATPPDGSVVLWLAGATHSAVVSAAGSITGYNQVVQFPPLQPNVGHTTGQVGQLAANQRVCVVIAEETIVGVAAGLDL